MEQSGILNPDPWKRWTALQASMHPFLTGDVSCAGPKVVSKGCHDMPLTVYWAPPWDPSICRRKLLCVQKAREKQNFKQVASDRSHLSEKVETTTTISHPSTSQNLVSPESTR